MLEGLLVAAVVLNVLILIGIVIGTAVIGARIGRAARIAEEALNQINKELPETMRAAQEALHSLDSLAARSEQNVERVDNILRSVDRLVSGKAVADTAFKAITGSRTTLASILVGIKEALRTIKKPAGDKKEDPDNG